MIPTTEIHLNEEAIVALVGGNKVIVNQFTVLYPPNFRQYHLTEDQYIRLRQMIRDECWQDFVELVKKPLTDLDKP